MLLIDLRLAMSRQRVASRSKRKQLPGCVRTECRKRIWSVRSSGAGSMPRRTDDVSTTVRLDALSKFAALSFLRLAQPHAASRGRTAHDLAQRTTDRRALVERGWRKSGPRRGRRRGRSAAPPRPAWRRGRSAAPPRPAWMTNLGAGAFSLPRLVHVNC